MGRPINYTLFYRFVKDFSCSDLEIHAGVALEVAAELVVLAGQDGVERDTHDGGGGQAREADGAYLHSARAGVGDADGQHQDEGGDDDIAALEDRLEQIDKEMAANATNAGKLRELSEEQQETQQKLDEKMDRWVYLNDLAEQIEAQKE